VRVHSGQHKVDLIEDLYGIKVPLEKSSGKYLTENVFGTKEKYLEFGAEAYGWKYGLRIKPVPYSFCYIMQLVHDGHEVSFISSRNEEQVLVGKALSKNMCLELRLTGVGYEKSKAEAVSEEECDVFVDDDFKKLVPLVGIVKHLFLFTQEYNKHVDARDVARRAANWPVLYQYIQEIDGSR